jgi:hypothetical protein
MTFLMLLLLLLFVCLFVQIACTGKCVEETHSTMYEQGLIISVFFEAVGV